MSDWITIEKQTGFRLGKWSPAVFISFNGCSFDRELQRRALWKNLYENPYLTEFNGNSHFDLLGVARAVSLFFPKAIKYKMNEKNPENSEQFNNSVSTFPLGNQANMLDPSIYSKHPSSRVHPEQWQDYN